uniref:Uncharacterized protein n=1 Tax=Trypanosoma vivax (strain Y486) TaxID=1055687 RepID=G0U3D0_TRYVY|nr:conserved hypothetical protein [Trypanosoma vivax Y486]
MLPLSSACLATPLVPTIPIQHDSTQRFRTHSARGCWIEAQCRKQDDQPLLFLPPLVGTLSPARSSCTPRACQVAYWGMEKIESDVSTAPAPAWWHRPCSAADCVKFIFLFFILSVLSL